MGQGARFGIIGGGFIGSEIAAALASNGEKVSMVFPEASMGVHIYPVDLSQYLNEYYQEKGVELHPGFELQTIERQGEQYVLRAKDGKAVVVDRLIAGIGIRPNIDLAESAGAAIADHSVGGGILVDKYLRTNLQNIFAAGDVVSFPNFVQGRTVRIEHADNANTMGRIVGLNMAGSETPYDHQPFFYSDLFDLGYEAVGELDSRLQTVPDWKEPFREGVIYYMKEDKVRGVLLWNTWDQVDAARKMIADGKTYQAKALKGRLPKR
jgi:NADPH-dependent 2,4-dienoyl-CoA reductase/sulfur reductase-like enzyme